MLAALLGSSCAADPAQRFAAAAGPQSIECALEQAAAKGYTRSSDDEGAIRLHRPVFMRAGDPPPNQSRRTIADYLTIGTESGELVVTAVGTLFDGKAAAPTDATVEHAKSIVAACRAAVT